MKAIFFLFLTLGTMVKGVERSIFEKLFDEFDNSLCLCVYEVLVEERARRYREITLRCTVVDEGKGRKKIGEKVTILVYQEPVEKVPKYLGGLYYQVFDNDDVTEAGIEVQAATTFPYSANLSLLFSKSKNRK